MNLGRRMCNILIVIFPGSLSSACFIYDKRAWVIFCSLRLQWYYFEKSNLAEKIYFIMLSFIISSLVYTNPFAALSLF